MKNKKLSIITIESLALIFSLIAFIVPIIILRNYKYIFVIAICLFILLIALNYCLISYLSINPILDATKKINHYNNNEFDFKMADNGTKEIHNLKLELDKLSQRDNDLTKKLQEKIYENESYYKQYKEDMEARKQLVAAINHEIKTPLQIIETTASAILDDVIPEDEIKQELKNIINETNRTNSMLKEIIGVYKTTMNLKELELQELNLKDILNEALVELSSLAKKHKQSIEILTPLDLQIEVNQVLFKQAINNILVNAITHSPSKSKITIALNEHPSYSALEIINSNARIDSLDANHLFDAFYRTDKSREKKEDLMNTHEYWK